MKKIILFIAAVLCFQTSDASHAAGGEIWYEHDTLNDYVLHFRFYRDCAGVGAPINLNMYYKSTSLSLAPQTLPLTIVNQYVLNSCTPSSCLNPASAYPGYEVYEYSASVTLSGPASDWYFYTYVSARNVSNNLTFGGTLYVDATLDNLNTPFNNSALPYSPINMVQFFNTQTTMHLPLLDIDGDSLDIYLVNPLSGNSNGISSNVNFQTPFTASNPFNSSPAPVLNSSNGNLTLYSGPIGQNAFAVRIDEYRSGTLIASTVRDYLLVYNSSNTNATPTLSGINNTSSFITTINVCPSASLSFTLNSADANTADSTFIDSLYTPQSATFTTNNAQNQIGTFNWTPTLADVQSQPYIVSFKVRDNNCAEQTYGYEIYVNNCNPDSVWAGDANADFTCDNYDVLNIGIANGQSGPTRPSATINWQAEWCADWTNSFISNINYKHADCNGDGTINSADLAAVTANYGLIHQKTSQIGQYKTLGLPDLYCDVTNVQAHKGSTVSIPVMLGTTGSLMNDFYGVSATVELLNAQTSAPIAVSKNVSWIGNATNSFDFEKSIAPNKSAFTFVRNDQQNLQAQQGQIGEISFPIDAASMIGSKVIVQFSDIKMVKNNGEEITDYNVLSDTMEILAPNATIDYDKGIAVSVFPNPNQGKITISISVDKTSDYSFTLYDAVGRKIKNNSINMTLSQGQHNIMINISDKAAGQYFLELKTDQAKKSYSSPEVVIY